MAQDKLLFVAQKAFIGKDGKLLVIFDLKNRIDIPGGKLQEGEADLGASLLREVQEEVAIDIAVGAPFTTWSFAMPKDHPRHAGEEVFLVGYACSYKSGEVKLSSDHLGYKWVSQDELQEFDDGSAHFTAMKKYFDILKI